MNKILLSAFAGLSLAVVGCASGDAPDADELVEQAQDELRGGPRVTLYCASEGFRYNTCPVSGRIERVRMFRQHSSSACVEGSSWGFGDGYVWVDRGCRADFDITLRREIVSRVVDCSSENFRPAVCLTGLARVTSVRVLRQESSSPCREGDSFGIDDDAIWVDRGCRARFEVKGYARD